MGTDKFRFLDFANEIYEKYSICNILSYKIEWDPKFIEGHQGYNEYVTFKLNDQYKDHYVFEDTGSSIDQFIGINILSSSNTTNIPIGSDQSFCKACSSEYQDSKYGESCWSISPNTDSDKSCGCNAGTSGGSGIFYGGYPDPECNTCTCSGGAFTGYTMDGQAKGGINSVGLRISIEVCDNLEWESQQLLQDVPLCGSVAYSNNGPITPTQGNLLPSTVDITNSVEISMDIKINSFPSDTYNIFILGNDGNRRPGMWLPADADSGRGFHTYFSNKNVSQRPIEQNFVSGVVDLGGSLITDTIYSIDVYYDQTSVIIKQDDVIMFEDPTDVGTHTLDQAVTLYMGDPTRQAADVEITNFVIKTGNCDLSNALLPNETYPIFAPNVTNGGWRECPYGYVMAGFFTANCTDYECIERIKCVTPSISPIIDQTCYDDTSIAALFDPFNGNFECNPGYFVSGIYAAVHQTQCTLHCWDRVRCCQYDTDFIEVESTTIDKDTTSCFNGESEWCEIETNEYMTGFQRGSNFADLDVIHVRHLKWTTIDIEAICDNSFTGIYYKQYGDNTLNLLELNYPYPTGDWGTAKTTTIPYVIASSCASLIFDCLNLGGGQGLFAAAVQDIFNTNNYIRTGSVNIDRFPLINSTGNTTNLFEITGQTFTLLGGPAQSIWNCGPFNGWSCHQPNPSDMINRFQYDFCS